MFELNPEQKRAVEYDGDKPLLIEAGPGAGKTRVLTERVEFLYRNGAVAESFLVITFTRKAANELKERLSERLGYDIANRMQISTIHSFCQSLLSEYSPEYDALEIIDDNYEKNILFIDKFREELGFVGENYIPSYELKAVKEKFNEYGAFNLDVEGMLEYLKKEFPVNNEFKLYIEDCIANRGGYRSCFSFPKYEARKDEIDRVKRGWHDAKHQAIVRAYPVYRELMHREGVIDFTFLQIEAMEFLDVNPGVISELPYSNILIDEFQDTDYVQMKIFEKFMEFADSFTVVGDDDQSIYKFRGSERSFFTEFEENYGAELISLNTNYRSSPHMVDFTESFIRDYRRNPENKKLHSAPNNSNPNKVVILRNKDRKGEADELLDVIKDLYSQGVAYSDIALLFRSMSSAKDIINLLKIEGIPYNVKGNRNLIEQDEIRSVLTLMHYVSGAKSAYYKFTTLERDWLNLYAYAGESFNSQDMFKLSSDTRKVFKLLEDEFRDAALANEKIEIEKFNKINGTRKRGTSKFEGIFSRDTNVVKDIFRPLDRIYINQLGVDELQDLGIHDSDDLDFFSKLQELKHRIETMIPEDEDKKEDVEFLSNLDIFYSLIEIRGYLSELTSRMGDPVSDVKLKNLALLSKSIFNYESIINRNDIRGFYWFITGNINRYDSQTEDSADALEIMTVHKSKGLEFPVTIVCGINDAEFPAKYEAPDPSKTTKKRNLVFVTPAKYLKHKKELTPSEEQLEEENEEKRILYVAMTRAEEVLILSHYGNDDSIILKELTANNEDNISKNMDDFEITTHDWEDDEEELLELNHTSIDKYNLCPFRYNLEYNYGFKTSETDTLMLGSIAHKALELLHHSILDGDKITRTVIEDFVVEAFKSETIELDEEEYEKQVTSISDNIEVYYNDFALNIRILETELPFDIIKPDYRLIGKIDLVYETPTGDIGILNFKNREWINPDYIDSQLYTYKIALESQGKYPSRKIFLGGYALVGNNFEDIPVSLEREYEVLDEIQEVACNIKNECFDRCPGEYCERCEFRFLCNVD